MERPELYARADDEDDDTEEESASCSDGRCGQGHAQLQLQHGAMETVAVAVRGSRVQRSSSRP
jgi:hypothetical protein